jgi:hypothetical protein
LLGQSGEIDAALTKYKELLKDKIRVLGSDDPDTFETRGARASTLFLNGQEDAGLTEYKEILKDQIRVFGPEATDTMTTIKIIAYLNDKDRKTLIL